MEPYFNIWTVLLTVAALQGVFIALMIFWRKSKINHLLGALTLSFSICLIYYIIFWTNSLSFFPNEIQVLGRFTYLIGPLMLFYIKSDSRKLYFKPVHFVPFILYIFLFPISQISGAKNFFDLFQNAHLIIYLVLVFSAVIKDKGTTTLSKKLYRWRLSLAWSYFGYVASFGLYYILVWTDNLRSDYDYAISVASSIFIYYIGIQGFQKQELLKVYENGKYTNSLLPKSAAVSILSKVRKFMDDEKPYLDSSLKMNEFAKSVGLSPHDVSQVINEMEGKNFKDFINQYRVEEAKAHLRSSKEQKIIHVAYDSGFNNKVSFYNAFKKFTGFSPSEYKESQSDFTDQLV